MVSATNGNGHASGQSSPPPSKVSVASLPVARKLSTESDFEQIKDTELWKTTSLVAGEWLPMTESTFSVTGTSTAATFLSKTVI